MFEGFAKIYVLTDRENQPFYIGCTVQKLQVRLCGHITEARKNHRYTNPIKNEKIRSLNFRVRIRLLFLLPVKAHTKWDAQRSCLRFERFWIRRFIDAGYELCNGNGMRGIRKNKILNQINSL